MRRAFLDAQAADGVGHDVEVVDRTRGAAAEEQPRGLRGAELEELDHAVQRRRQDALPAEAPRKQVVALTATRKTKHQRSAHSQRARSARAHPREVRRRVARPGVGAAVGDPDCVCVRKLRVAQLAARREDARQEHRVRRRSCAREIRRLRRAAALVVARGPALRGRTQHTRACFETPRRTRRRTARRAGRGTHRNVHQPQPRVVACRVAHAPRSAPRAQRGRTEGNARGVRACGAARAAAAHFAVCGASAPHPSCSNIPPGCGRACSGGGATARYRSEKRMAAGRAFSCSLACAASCSART